MEIYEARNLTNIFAEEAKTLSVPEGQRDKLFEIFRERLDLLHGQGALLFSYRAIAQGILKEWALEKEAPHYFELYKRLMFDRGIPRSYWLSMEEFFDTGPDEQFSSPYERFRTLQERDLRVGDRILRLRSSNPRGSVQKIIKITSDCYLLLPNNKKVNPFDAQRLDINDDRID